LKVLPRAAPARSSLERATVSLYVVALADRTLTIWPSNPAAVSGITALPLQKHNSLEACSNFAAEAPLMLQYFIGPRY
jgi:hypothetical protein